MIRHVKSHAYWLLPRESSQSFAGPYEMSGSAGRQRKKLEYVGKKLKYGVGLCEKQTNKKRVQANRPKVNQ